MTVPIRSLVGKPDRDVPMSPLLDDGDVNIINTISSEKEEERSLVIESTAQFEGEHKPLLWKFHPLRGIDWVVAFFNRCIALFESLPEEGGRNKKTGGKQEEAMLSGIREAVDVVCFQLSDEIFDVVLNRIFQYAASNTKLNTMRAFTHLVRRLTRTNPEKALAKFLPHCTKQVTIELELGAASVATTSTHEAVHSDTALLWSEHYVFDMINFLLTRIHRLVYLTCVCHSCRDCCMFSFLYRGSYRADDVIALGLQEGHP